MDLKSQQFELKFDPEVTLPLFAEEFGLGEGGGRPAEVADEADGEGVSSCSLELFPAGVASANRQ